MFYLTKTSSKNRTVNALTGHVLFLFEDIFYYLFNFVQCNCFPRSINSLNIYCIYLIVLVFDMFFHRFSELLDSSNQLEALLACV